MSKRKLILILLPLFFITGCGTVKYDLDIRRDNVYEHLNIALNDYYDNSELKLIVDENINSYSFSQTKNFSYEVNSNNINIFNNFDNIYDVTTNKIIGILYNTVHVNTKENITTVTFKDYNTSSFICGEFDESCSLVLDKVIVSLTSEYEITSNNADFVDTENNKYTWILDAESGNIYFSYNDNILWNIVIKNFLRDNSQTIILVTICIVILLVTTIATIKFLKTMKENNS